MNNKTQDADLKKGVPTLAFFPAKEKEFGLDENTYEITVPLNMSYNDLDKGFKSKNLVQVIDDNNIVNISIISKVLFFHKKYPKLDHNQLFLPLIISVNKSKEVPMLIITGKVVTIFKD